MKNDCSGTLTSDTDQRPDKHHGTADEQRPRAVRVEISAREDGEGEHQGRHDRSDPAEGELCCPSRNADGTYATSDFE